MHISKIKISGQKRACENNPSFGNAEKFVFITVDNSIFDESLGGNVNEMVKGMIDRALRSGATALQMAGEDMKGKTTFAIYKQNITTAILQGLIGLSELLVIDNIECKEIGYVHNGVNLVDSWQEILEASDDYSIITNKELAQAKIEFPVNINEINNCDDIKQLIRDLELTDNFDLRKSEDTLKSELKLYYDYE